jgi:hypothetical protein
MLFIALALIGAIAQAAPAIIFQESKTVQVTGLQSINLQCVPGRVNGPNKFPGPTSPSRLELRSIRELMPTANTETLTVIDPTDQDGNRCTQLIEQANSALPGELTLNRTVSEQTQLSGGVCVHSYVEYMRATLGWIMLKGSTQFTAEVLPQTACQN